MSLITLTTDFGIGSPYVATMKGVIWSIHPEARVVDITHAIPPQNIRAGALALEDTTPWFPPGSIHVAVVDPGVGSERRIVYAEIEGRHYVAPDNGLLSRLAARHEPSRIVAVEAPEFWLPRISATFHGRDIMAPVAARLSRGLAAERLGTPLDKLISITWPEVVILPRSLRGSVESIDSFGNLITDITEAMLADVPRDESVRIICDEHETLGIFRTYADQPPATLLAIIGSSGRLELAIVEENAAAMLGIRAGAPVEVTW
ncbi:MAG TPA: SAM-dependent chlorinase/fluorinase [Pirellulales bacterium]|nr:SAM-dependent chlorinase/fluorinase [Pirellulales bacterium]